MNQCNQWFIVELSDMGSSAGHAEIQNAICEVFGESVEYFIPIHHEKIGSYISTSILFDGYVFIKDCPTARIRLAEICDCKLFQKVLRNSGKIYMLNSTTIGAMKRRLKNSLRKNVRVGSHVKIVNGVFENLEGEVINIEDRGKTIVVKIERPTRVIIAPVPSTSIVEI